MAQHTLRTRKELAQVIAAADRNHRRSVDGWLAHVVWGAYELEEATTDESRIGILDCIMQRARLARAGLIARQCEACAHGDCAWHDPDNQ